MANFYATYSPSSPSGAAVVTANQGTSPWIVAGGGTAGTAATGVVTIQGIAGGTAVPITGTVAATNPSVSTTGTAIPASATMVGGSDGTNLRAVKVAATGLMSVDGSAVTQPVSGTVAVSNFPATQPVSGTVAVSNFPATQPVSGTVAVTQSTSPWVVSGTVAATQSGTWSVQPIAGRSSSQLATLDYSSTNVTTTAYVELVASTAAVINRLYVFDSSGLGMILATGAAMSEVDKVYIPPGGTPYPFEIAIPAATRISLKALYTDATTGRIIVTGLS